MFSLIITIVSIALVVALVAATMYHGGDTLTQGRTTADAAAFVSGAQQIGGAQVMHISLESAPAADVPALVTAKYLASAPVVKATVAGWSIDNTAKLVKAVTLTDDVCLQINKTAGVPKATLDGKVVAAADFAALPYGCDTATKTFQFKF
jgi:hypothetical protein